MEKQISVDVDGKVFDVLVIAPTNKINREAEKEYQKALMEALRDKLPIAAEIDQELESRFDLNKEREEREEIIKDLSMKQVMLRSGNANGRKLTKMQGRALAIEMMDARDKLSYQSAVRRALYTLTAERKADLARTNYLVYLCSLDPKTRKPYFANYDDYLDNKDSNLVLEIIKTFGEVTSVDYSDIPDDPEIAWLKKFNFMDKEGRFINNDGKLVDRDMRLIDENGRYIDQNGNFVDKFGHPVDAEGEQIIVEDPLAYSE